MSIVNRVLLLVVLIELAVCGRFVVGRMQRPTPWLPAMKLDDPLLSEQLTELAERAESGTARDWLALGHGLLGQGFYVEAEHSFRSALELDSRLQPARFGLAFCLDRTGRSEECRREYAAAAELPSIPNAPETDRAHALYAIGRSYLRDCRTDEAEAAFIDNQGFLPADYQLCKLWIRSGQAARAVPIIDAALEEVPHSLWFTFLKYRALSALGRDDEAYAAAEALERTHHQVPLSFGTLYVEPLHAALGLNHELQDYKQLVANRDLQAMQAVMSRIVGRIGAQASPHRSIAEYSLAAVALEAGDAQILKPTVQSLLEQGDRSAEVLYFQAGLRRLEHDAPAALADLQCAAAMSPTVPILAQLAGAYRSVDDPVHAAEVEAEQQLLTAKLHYRDNRIAEAKAAIDLALQLNPDLSPAWFYLGEIQRLLGDLKASQAAYQRCLELAPEFTRAANRLQWIAAQADSQ